MPLDMSHSDVFGLVFKIDEVLFLNLKLSCIDCPYFNVLSSLKLTGLFPNLSLVPNLSLDGYSPDLLSFSLIRCLTGLDMYPEPVLSPLVILLPVINIFGITF